MTGWAKASCLAGKHQEALLSTVWTAKINQTPAQDESNTSISNKIIKSIFIVRG